MGDNNEVKEIYIDGQPVWQIGEVELTPEEIERYQQEGTIHAGTGESADIKIPIVLNTSAESARAELRAQAFSPEVVADTWDSVLAGFRRAAKRIANAALLAIETDPKVKHYFRNCKKLRVRKKYKNRMMKNLRERVDAMPSQEEAEE